MAEDKKPGIPECCRKAENLERFETSNPSVYIMRCRECGRNHYHLIAEPACVGAIPKT